MALLSNQSSLTANHPNNNSNHIQHSMPRRSNHYHKRHHRPKQRKPKEPPKCGVCNINESKYKFVFIFIFFINNNDCLTLFRCPNCRVMRYCSVACYKLHKQNEEECVKPGKKQLRFDKNEPVSITGYTVSQQQFQSLSMQCMFSILMMMIQ